MIRHRYWVRYHVAIDLNIPGESTPDKIMRGEAVMPIEREQPIGDFADIFGLAQFIASQVAAKQTVDPSRVSVEVWDWTKLESSVIEIPPPGLKLIQ